MSISRGPTVALVGPDAMIRHGLSMALRRQGFRKLSWTTSYAPKQPIGRFVVNTRYGDRLAGEFLGAGCIVVWCGPSAVKPSPLHSLMGLFQAHVFSVNEEICTSFITMAVQGKLQASPGDKQYWFGALATESLTYDHPRKGE